MAINVKTETNNNKTRPGSTRTTRGARPEDGTKGNRSQRVKEGRERVGKEGEELTAREITVSISKKAEGHSERH